jgi:hypothetical protein
MMASLMSDDAAQCRNRSAKAEIRICALLIPNPAKQNNSYQLPA